jgi:hypothetical protein
MPIHESSINFKKLIQDLADMYPFDVSEVVVTELIANALDAKATQININYDANKKILIIEDNGCGMSKDQFDEYHDFAAGFKNRGTGIGFAGLGAKISFNIASRVLTETKSFNNVAGSNWYLESNKKLVWEDLKPSKIKQKGTRVEVHFNQDYKIVFKDRKDIFDLIKRNYLPLLDIRFLNIYHELGYYSKDLRFVINGIPIEPFEVTEKFQLEKVKTFLPMKRSKPYGCGIFGISKEEYPITSELCGVLLCTFGKVIKADFFNQFPGAFGTRIFGIVEIPEFINFLTTQKTDFTKRGQFKKFESLMSPIRTEFILWLKEIGVESKEILEKDDAIKLEREIKKILDDIPEITQFFGFWSKKHILAESDEGNTSAENQEGRDASYPDGLGERGESPGLSDTGDQDGFALKENKEGEKKALPISRSSKRGPKIGFREEKDKIELAWVEGNNIIINIGHPIYEKVKSNNKYKTLIQMFSIAGAIQKYKGADESEAPDFLFIDRMMAAWGRASEKN